MIRALYAAVSGLYNHQLKLDVIGNNIANVNTYGFKGSRITFAEALAQQEGAPYAPHDRFGGVNPMEVGLGVKTSSIDNNFAQGNLLSTGITTDLAIQDDGFFVLSDGLKNFYTRAGAFQIDANGNLVAQGGKYFVQGRMADASGNIASGTNVQNITLPFGEKEPANATTAIDYFCNLSADSDALNEIWTTQDGFTTFASVAGSGAPTSLVITAGTNDQMTINYNNGAAEETITIAAATYTDVDELVAAINTAIEATDLNGYVEAEVVAGAVRFKTTQTGADISLELTAVAGNTGLANLNITSGSSDTGVADAAALLNDLAQANLVVGDKIIIEGTNPDGTTISAEYTYADGDTLEDLIDDINTAYSGATVSLNSNGKLVLTDNVAGTSSTTINLSPESGVSFDISSFDNTVDGRAYGTHSTSINVYDSLGNAHLVEMIFTKSPEANAWTWKVEIDNGLITTTLGGSGTLAFNADGSLKTFKYDTGSGLEFTPEGADPMSIELNPGTIGIFDGITQFDSPSTTIAVAQDGYTMGDLENISIGVDGIISGAFSNGVVRDLGQIVIADFSNTGGLSKVGNNMFVESPNSGQAVVGLAGTNFESSINSGYLEMSNVDLAREFTELIVAQRGFQANARVIQTSDMVLAEINGLKR